MLFQYMNSIVPVIFLETTILLHDFYYIYYTILLNLKNNQNEVTAENHIQTSTDVYSC